MTQTAPSTGRTLLSVNNYYYRRAGAEGVFLDHNSLMEDAGWQIVPFAMQHEQNLETEWSRFFPEEIELGRPYSAWRKLKSGVKAVYSIEARRKVGELVQAVRPDICHGHNVYHHLSPSILKAIKAHDVPIALTLHDLKLACPAYSMLTHDGICERCKGGRSYQVAVQRCIKGSVALSTLIMVEAYLHRVLNSYDAVDRFVVPSRFYLNKFVEWGFDANRFVHIPNFVDTNNLKPDTKPGTRFLYLGRLGLEKGVGTLIRAAARAKVGVDIAGTGPVQSELQALAQQTGADVEFLGFLSGSDLHGTIRGARAVVLPSEWYENAPLSILEAYALGKPVIVSSFGGLPEMVEDGETGLIFEGRDEKGLASRLTELSESEDGQLQRMGEAGLERVNRDFSLQRYWSSIQELYEELLG